MAHDEFGDSEELGLRDTERAPPLEIVPFAQAPCDAPDCTLPWKEHVTWMSAVTGELVERYACARHAYLYLMSAEPMEKKQ